MQHREGVEEGEEEWTQEEGGEGEEEVLRSEEEGVVVAVSRTKDWRFLTLNLNTRSSSEVYLLDAHSPQGAPQLLQGRQEGVQWFVEHHGGWLYAVTNQREGRVGEGGEGEKGGGGDGGGDGEEGRVGEYRIVRAPVGSAHFADSWQSLVIGVEGSDVRPSDVVISDIEVFRRCLAIHCLIHTLPHLLLLPLPPPGERSVTGAESVRGESSSSHACREVVTGGEEGTGLEEGGKEEWGGEEWRGEGESREVEVWARAVQLPERVCHVVAGGNQDHNATDMRIMVSSPVMPEAVCAVHMPSGALSLLHQEPYDRQPNPHHQQQPQQPQQQQRHQQLQHQQEQPIDISPSTSPPHSPSTPLPLSRVPGLACQRVWARAEDGTAVPLTLIHHEGRRTDATGPALLEGYGAYGEVMAADWVPHRLPLLHRGWTIALAHTRGGGELGHAWHEAGRGEQKRRAVGDLMACAKYLVREGWAGRDRLAARGSSGGGFLVAAAVNADPSLFQAVVLDVPFLDGLASMCNPALPLTVLDRHEWGDPLASPAAFRALRALCPVLNVQPGVRYPAALLSTALHDSRVGPWEPLKWAARVREESEYDDSERPVVVRVWGDRGHVAPSSGREQLEDVALEHAFLLRHVGGSG
ncbi:hypothetical protein CLOM_g8516 [Closterium sp. NIES-68]|nr:hypothetical protein CLOM_g8516 [Closterium sp. NIES-68]GJP83783.1 hypothetical protein CLOP_g13891 [Closterium sp. NIES-67]